VSRLQGVPERTATWITRLLFRGIRRRVGRLADTWTIAAHQPGLLLGWALHELSYERARTVDRRLRTLAQLKVAVLVGCPG
jgi:hypothetical protein